MILRIIDGQPDLIPIMYNFDKFVHAEKILGYFLKEGWTGVKFREIYQNKFKLSWLTMGKYAVMKLKKEKNMKPIFAGKDFQT